MVNKNKISLNDEVIFVSALSRKGIGESSIKVMNQMENNGISVVYNEYKVKGRNYE